MARFQSLLTLTLKEFLSISPSLMEQGVLTYFLPGICVFLFWQFGTNPACAQEIRQLRNEVSFTSINDNFIPPFSDRYYTNGINIAFSHALDAGFLKRATGMGDLRKSILRLEFGQNIYTPSSIEKTKIPDLDRPYAGYLFFRSSIHSFWNHTRGLKLGIDAGVIGPRAGGEIVQNWWHKLINYKIPKGWEYQIENVPVLNFDFNFQQSWINNSDFNLLPNIGIQTGTAFNNISAGMVLRAGEFNRFDHSAITKSVVHTNAYSRFENKTHKRERFIFLGVNNQLVFYNTLIEGGVFRPSKNVHTEKTHFNLTTVNVGFAYSTALLTGIISVYQLSPEVVNGKGHIYASIELAMRF